MQANLHQYKSRIQELLAEGEALILLEKPTVRDPKIKTIQNGQKLQAWITSVHNIILGAAR